MRPRISDGRGGAELSPAAAAGLRGRAAPGAQALLRACRPRQWVKNVLVVTAPAAAGILTHPEVAGQVAVAFVCFCALSSATYLLNDVHDRHEDRASPARRTRPVAAGELSVPLALAAAATLALGGLALAAALRPALAAVGAGYLVLTVSYTLWLRSIAVADLAAVAGGFVLRALAGGAATEVALSRWFMLVACFGALFLVAGKRYAELVGVPVGGVPVGGVPAATARPTLQAYSAEYLRLVLGLAAAVATTGYCLWAFQRAHTPRLSWYELSVVPFVLWLLRYALLVHGGAGRAPEELVVRDRFLLCMGAAWLAVFVVGVYVAG